MICFGLFCFGYGGSIILGIWMLGIYIFGIMILGTCISGMWMLNCGSSGILIYGNMILGIFIYGIKISPALIVVDIYGILIYGILIYGMMMFGFWVIFISGISNLMIGYILLIISGLIVIEGVNNMLCSLMFICGFVMDTFCSTTLICGCDMSICTFGIPLVLVRSLFYNICRTWKRTALKSSNPFVMLTFTPSLIAWVAKYRGFGSGCGWLLKRFSLFSLHAIL